MMYHVEGLLSAEDLAHIHSDLEGRDFIDGRSTAGPLSAQLKVAEHIQVDRITPHQQRIIDRMFNHPDIMELVHANTPFRMGAPRVVRYPLGGGYGWHTDTSISQKGVRLDVSCTVFLNDPADYDGGEIEIETPVGMQSFKLPAGDALLYPAGYLHQVCEVTRGERLVAINWTETGIRDPLRRELLYRLSLLCRDLEANTDALLKADFVRQNLIRMWFGT